MSRIRLTLVVALAAAIAGCRKDNLETVRVSGASTVYPIVQMAGEHLRDQRLLRVEAQAGGSTRGYMDTLAGRNDLGAMARELTDEESSQVTAFPIAWDGVAIILHQANSVAGLSTSDLRRIYQKQAVDWSEFGGTQGTITVVSKAEGHATLQTFLDHTRLTRRQLLADVLAGNNAQVIQAVANAPRAIGYVSLGEAMHAMSSGMAVKLIELDAVKPTLDAVVDGSWPVRRKLYLVSKAQPEGGSQKLLEFLRSDEGSEIIARGGYVPLR